MPLENWTHLFKPDVRNKGQRFLDEEKVSSPRPSDTEVQIFVRDSSGAKVTLSSDTVGSRTLTADCNCPFSRKGQFCKHIWAALLTVEEKTPDFLESKTELVKADFATDEAQARTAKFEPTAAQIEKQEAYRQKQSDYRKQQYQKQKQRLKESKRSEKASRFGSAQFPAEVEGAFEYFSANGFSLKESLSEESVGAAKKQLSRVFHPDKGGSHAEILELNSYARILEDYLKS